MKRIMACAILLFGLCSPMHAMEKAKDGEKSIPKVVLLDLGGLFYVFSKMSYAWEMGIGRILTHMVLDFKVPSQGLIFGSLNQIPKEEIDKRSEDFKDTLLYKRLKAQGKENEMSELVLTRSASGKELPHIVSAFQAGRISPETALELSHAKIDELFKEGHYTSKRQADIVKRAAELIFTPEINAAQNGELWRGIELLKEIKAAQFDNNGERRFILVALSNVDRYSTKLLEERWKNEIYGLFDYKFYSGELGTVKPNQEAYEIPFDQLRKLIDEIGFDPKKEDTVFLDDQQENVDAAQKFGIAHPILYKNAAQARKELERLGILGPKEDEGGVSYATVGITAFGVVAACLAYKYLR